MEFHHLVISTYVLIFFVLARETYGHASLPDEDYWQAVWPNTPIPSALQDLLKPGPTGVEINDLPMQIDDTQYPKPVFLQRDLYPGKTMNVQFTNIPFGQPLAIYFVHMNEIKDIEKWGSTFSDLCGNEAKEEDMYCAKSLGTLIDFVMSKLGKNIRVLSSSFVNKQEQYTVEGVQNVGNKVVICHRLNFHKVVFFCHELNATTAFMVPLVAGDGTQTHALAICHADIPILNHDLILQILKFNPGTNPLCHFTGNKDMVWVPNLVVDNANVAS